MSYKVYTVDYLGAPVNHNGIFVETHGDLSGHLFQVSGNIQNGMYFNHRDAKRPEESHTYISKEQIGIVSKANYERIESTVNQIDPPKKQYERATRLYPNEPVRRCREWTADAIQVLKTAGILEA